jgi:DNA-damage-inducible protein J
MSTIQVRTDEMTKTQAAEIFGVLGITMSDAINMFLRQSIMHGGLPFDLRIPKYNAVTQEAIAEMQQSKGKGIRGVGVKTALAQLKEEDE